MYFLTQKLSQYILRKVNFDSFFQVIVSVLYFKWSCKFIFIFLFSGITSFNKLDIPKANEIFIREIFQIITTKLKFYYYTPKPIKNVFSKIKLIKV